MAGTIEYIQNAVKLAKKDWAQKFPAIDDVMIIHNQALAQICPMYIKQYIDDAPTAFYVMAKMNPLKGACDRKTACAWLEDLFYDKCECPSSYDIEAGGTMSRQTAISKELLPADNDAEYMDYYQEQMAKMKEMFADEQKAAAKEEFIKKHGFDPDDPDIIDVPADGEEAPAQAASTAVQQSAGTEVGMPKPIWYGAVFHANGFGAKLGYDKKAWTLSQGSVDVSQLGYKDGPQQLAEAADEKARKLDELIAMCDPQSGLRIALDGVRDRFFGGEKLDEGAELSQDDMDDIADMFAGYGAGATSLGAGRTALEGFMRAHASELNSLRRGQASGLGDFAAARDVGSDDEQVAESAETDREINEILGDDASETEREIEACSRIEDEAEEDDDMLSESVIRKAADLSREVW